MRVGAMFYYRTNRDQLGNRDTARPTDVYIPFDVNVPDGPNGATVVTAYNLPAALNHVTNVIRDNRPDLDTTYKGVEFTAAKRFSNNWQMIAGLTFGKNDGGQAAAISTIQTM